MSTLQSPIVRGGTIRRSGTRKAADGPPKHPKSLDIVQQYIKQLHPAEDKEGEKSSEIDLVFVPGLGADPEKSWKSKTGEFNWIKSEDGIIKDFPRARVLLFMYESAWYGDLKVKQQFIDNIARTLLLCLKGKRKNCKSRPIVFIGHSMGGLVVAKAVTLAHDRRDQYPGIYETTSATIFFGTPFKGTEFAVWATAYAREAEKSGNASYSKLLDFLTPGNEALRMLRQEFTGMIAELSPKIQLVCFWEQEQSDFSKMLDLAGHTDATRSLIPSEEHDFVTQDSAVLDGVDIEQGLKSDHRDLVKFDGPKAENWCQIVREHLREVVKKAPSRCKNRLAAAGGIDWIALKGIADVLGGTQVEKRRVELEKTVTPSSWLTSTQEYSQWFGTTAAPNDQTSPEKPSVDCVWVRGREGRGKTGATISALNHVEAFIKDNSKRSNGQDTLLVAYFFCEPLTDYCTAEDLLRSILGQLIDQQTRLATYAKMFIKGKSHGVDGTSRSQRDGISKSQAQPTVENLLQCLQDMLTDEAAGRRVYLVINNLHVLPEESDSTTKLMDYLHRGLKDISTAEDGSDEGGVSIKWFVTSRDTSSIRRVLGTPDVRLVDLEVGEYGDKVKKDLRTHARARVAALQNKKHYNKALAYFASSLIGQHAHDIHWIDITCVQLEELSEAESHLEVRRILEETPQDLSKLLNDAWKQIFQASDDHSQKIKEILRALILAFEDPSVAELSLLAGLSTIDEDYDELHGLIGQCKPFLVVDQTVGFMNPAVKAHLQRNAEELLGLSAEVISWQHGVLALRALSHIKDAFNLPSDQTSDQASSTGSRSENDDGEDLSDDGASNDDASSTRNGEDDSGSEESTEANDSGTDSDGSDYGDSLDYDDETSFEADSDESSPETDELEDMALSYPVKHWLHHGSKATAEFADDLALDDIWERESLVRPRWLMEYTRMTGDFDDFAPKSLGALHVAASVGFCRLVSSLLDHEHQDELHEFDSLGNTPLHLAASFGRPNIIKELLDRDAEIDRRKEGDDTPLHMAAENGHVDVMKKLIFKGASLNAYSDYSGLVINAAISSGKTDAIKLLVDKGVSLTPDESHVALPPLAQAAAMSDSSVLHFLMERFADRLPPEEYSKALVSAAGAGRMEAFKRLHTFQHNISDIQKAMDRAAKKAKWDVVTFLLEGHSGLRCDEAFYRAAIGPEKKDEVLEALWEYSLGSIPPTTLDRSLYVSTDRKKYDTVKLLLEKFGADPNATGKTYGNALTAAAYDGSLEILRLLLDNGAEVNSQDGWAIQTAAKQGHVSVVQELIDRRADVNASTPNPGFPEATALQGATEAGKQDVVALLLQHGADPNRGGGDNAPPILASAIFAEEEILAMLVDAKADVNVVDGRDQWTPLANAAGYISGTRSLRKLLDAGADINAVGEDGTTALITAAVEGDEEVAKFLLENGADVMCARNDGVNALKAAHSSTSDACIEVLVDHVSSIMLALKQAMDAGNTAITDVVRSATARGPEMERDGPSGSPSQPSNAQVDEETSLHREFDDAARERESFHVLVRGDKTALSEGSLEASHHQTKTVNAAQQKTASNELFFHDEPQPNAYQQMSTDPSSRPSISRDPEAEAYPRWVPQPRAQLPNENDNHALASRQSSPHSQLPTAMPRRKPLHQPSNSSGHGPAPTPTATGYHEHIGTGAYTLGSKAADGRILQAGPESQPNPHSGMYVPMVTNTYTDQNQHQQNYSGNWPQQQPTDIRPQYQDSSSYDGDSWEQPQPRLPYQAVPGAGFQAYSQPSPPPRPPAQQSHSSPAMIQQYRGADYAQHPQGPQQIQAYDPGRVSNTQQQQRLGSSGNAPRPSSLANFYSRFRKE